jgi:2-dehydro-3-deoxy-D-arabinonate dehydratase
VTLALFRVALRDGTTPFARGEVDHGPTELLMPDVSLAGMLAAGADAFADTLRSARSGGAVPGDARPIAPVDVQEIWAAGVTYERSRVARMDESADPSVYDRVYEAARPELFFKAPAWRVRGPGESIGIRTDSEWDVPEPELALVVTADLVICGYTIANDVSSRTIEGENPLYLPQAKIYDGSCAIGPGIVPVGSVELPLAIRLLVMRDGTAVVDASTSTERLRRPLEDLAAYLGRALTLPHGAVLLTGTGIVPGEDFSLQEADVVRIEIEGLGALENPVVSVGEGATERESATVGIRPG